MDSSPTLHDFVLNLLCDSTARSAFELDPEGVLQDAGLGDITAADVREVIPLVVDYAPVEGISNLPVADNLPTDVPDVDIAGAVRQLQSVTQQLPIGDLHPSGDFNVTTASAVTAGSGGLLADPLAPVGGINLGGLSLDGLNLDQLGLDGAVPAVDTVTGVTDGLSAAHDPAAGIDASVLAPVGGVTTGVVAGADHVVADTAVDGTFGTLDTTVNGVDALTRGVLDPLHLDHGAILPATTSTVNSVVGGVDSSVGGVVDVDSPLHGVGHTVTGVGSDAVDGLGDTVHGAVGDDPTGITDLLF